MQRETTRLRQLIRDIALNPVFVAALLVFGWQLTILDRLPEADAFPGRVIAVEGTVAEPPQLGPDFLYFELTRVVLGEHPGAPLLQGRIAVTVSLSPDALSPLPEWGERVAFRGQLREPPYYLTPGVADARVRGLRRGIVRVCYLKSQRQLERVAPAPAWKAALSTYRRAFLRSSSDFLTNPIRALVEASFLGNRRALSPRFQQDLRNTQLVHLFAISGFHVTVILGACYWLTRPLGRAGLLLANGLMWVYVLLIGAPMTALRAAFTNSVAYFGWQIGFRKRFFNTLGLAALVLLGGWPSSGRTAGFQFSFLALIAIGIYLTRAAPRARAQLRGIRSAWRSEVSTERTIDTISSRSLRFATEQFFERWRESSLVPECRRLIGFLQYPVHWFCLSLLIQALTLPLSLFYTNRVCWVQLPANLLLGPLFSVFLLLVFFSFLTFWTPMAPILFGLLEWIGQVWLWLISAMASWGLESWLPHPSAALTLLCAGLSGCLMWISRWTFLPGLLVGSLLASGLVLAPARPADRHLTVTLLDVGQGDCLHIRYPDGTNGLVDTGGLVFSDDPDFLARTVVARYLWEQGVRQLRYLLLSHNHLDHVQGAEFLSFGIPYWRVVDRSSSPDPSSTRLGRGKAPGPARRFRDSGSPTSNTPPSARGGGQRIHQPGVGGGGTLIRRYPNPTAGRYW